MKKIRILAILLLPSSLIIAQEKVSGYSSDLDSVLTSSVSIEIPGLVAAVCIDDKIAWKGSACIPEASTGLGTDKLFGIASISKTFSSVLALKLIEEGKLSMDDYIGEYLYGCRFVDDSVTIEQLLNHTSGLSDPLQNPSYFQTVMDPANQKIWSPSDILKTFLTEPYFEPGNAWSYSNANTIILGLIIEKIEGSPYHEVLRKKILEPANLNNTYLFPDEEIDFTKVSHYWYDFDRDGTSDDITEPLSMATLHSTVWAGGGIVSDISDLARWGYQIFNSGIISRESIKMIMGSGVQNGEYSYGFIKRKIGKSETYGHTGGFTHSGELVYVPDLNVSIAVLTNASVIGNVQVMDVISGIIDDIYRVLKVGEDSGNNDEDIHKVVKEGDLKKVKQILSVKPELLNAEEKIGHTPLSLSAVYARWDIFRYLLDSGADVNIITRSNTTVLHAVCHHDRPDMAALLLKKGGDPCLKVEDTYGEYTPMLRAVQSGCENMVEFLFHNGASPDEATKEDWNALHLAAKCGHRHLFAMLKENGVDVDATDRAGNKPMDYDFNRPEQVFLDDIAIQEYTGNFTWKGAPEDFFVTFFLDNGKLILDDYCLNELYPIGEDVFYCSQDPWKIKFYRNSTGEIINVELFFLRQNVLLNRVTPYQK